MQEIKEAQVRSLGQEDPLEEGMATLSSTLAWKIPWIEEPGGLQSVGLQRVGLMQLMHIHQLATVMNCNDYQGWQEQRRRENRGLHHF